MANIDELIGKLAQDAPAVKPAPHPLKLSLQWIIFAALYLALSLAVSGLRPDLMQQFEQPWFFAEIAILTGIFITTAVSAALLAYPDLHQKRSIAFAPAFMFAIFVLTIFFAWLADTPPAPLPLHSIECTLGITMIALLPAGWMLYVMRRYATTHSQWAGSIALLSAFSVGALWLRLYEQNDSMIHVIQWHYLPMLIFALVGMVLGKLVLKW